MHSASAPCQSSGAAAARVAQAELRKPAPRAARVKAAPSAPPVSHATWLPRGCPPASPAGIPCTGTAKPEKSARADRMSSSYAELPPATTDAAWQQRRTRREPATERVQCTPEGPAAPSLPRALPTGTPAAQFERLPEQGGRYAVSALHPHAHTHTHSPPKLARGGARLHCASTQVLHRRTNRFVHVEVLFREVLAPAGRGQ